MQWQMITCIATMHTLRRMSDTRWSSHADALSTLRMKFQSNIEAFQALANDGNKTSNFLLCVLTTFEFILSLTVVEFFLGYTAEIFTNLQRENCDLLKVVKHGHNAIIKTIRQKGVHDDEAFHQL